MKHHTVDDDSETNLTEISADLAQMQVTNAGQQVAAHTSCNELSADELEQRLKDAIAAASTQTAKEGLLSLFRSGRVQLLTHQISSHPMSEFMAVSMALVKWHRWIGSQKTTWMGAVRRTCP